MATGNTLCLFTPHEHEPPSTNAATLDMRNRHPVLDFDDTTNESTVFTCVMPQHYAGGGVTVFLHFSMATAEADSVDWDVAFERIGDEQLDVDGDSFAAANSADNEDAPGTTGLVKVASVNFTDGADMASVAVGELFRLEVTRDADSDDATGDAELHAVEIREQ